VHAERTADQAVQRAARELRFARRHTHDQLHRYVWRGPRRVAQRKNGPWRGSGPGTLGSRALGDK
jgi:hypothetical protein